MNRVNPFRWWRAWRHRRDDAAVVAALAVLGESSPLGLFMQTMLTLDRLHGALGRLTEAGIITCRLSRGIPPRRVYRLTEGGE